MGTVDENGRMPDDVIQVFLANDIAKNVRVDPKTTIQRIISVLLDGMGMDRLSMLHFAVRLAQSPSVPGTSQSDCHWLHPGLRITQLVRRYSSPRSLLGHYRFELRIRFVPKNLQEMYQTETAAFLYLYEQLSSDYVKYVSWKVKEEEAIHMASLMLRKRFPDLTAHSTEKKLDFELIEEEGGLLRYLPESVVVSHKSKQLHKLIVSGVKKVVGLSEIECVFHFLTELTRIARFDTEIFRASYGYGWVKPIEIHVGHEIGISYRQEHAQIITRLADLKTVTDISIRRLDKNSEKWVVNVRISAKPSPLVVTMPTRDIAESLAHLIDGYQMLLSQQPSVWSLRDLIQDDDSITQSKQPYERTLSPARAKTKLPPMPPPVKTLPLSNGDTTKNWDIDKSAIRLEQLLGDGQFGIVYRGTYTDKGGNKQLVAVKVCRAEKESQDISAINKYLLDEAYTMQQFNHPHIIRLIGICTEGTVGAWCVMELAQYGELRVYLIREKASIDLSVQILFSHQLASALSYLHERQFIHRDIAARNCLVATPQCVKLSDFGLSRQLEDEPIYTSSYGKLPIKWMAPESLNFRKFTTKSDVYMFGVCVWEILSNGIKPWQGVRNHEVIMRVERGELLEQPPNCPKAMYDLLRVMWMIEPKFRISMQEVANFLEHLLEEIDHGVPFDELSSPNTYILKRFTPDRNGVDNREHRKSVPVLNVDSSLIPTSTIWRALEEQRIQSEEDDRWLEEEERHLFSQLSISHADEKVDQNGNSTLANGNETCQLPEGLEFDRENDKIHDAVIRVVQAVVFLSRTYALEMTNTRFIELVKNITEALELLFNESIEPLKQLHETDRKQVELVETLLNTDLKNMTKAMNKVIEETSCQSTCDYHRKEVLKIASMLAVNCKHFLDSIDTARFRAATAILKSKSIGMC
uniref:receptor protein-tyrosine kinase n=2 Tax=Acrobeloides nanus TaxID=290746 RepID=A0A914C5E6_9BILA